jgi:cytochrome P450
LEQSIEEYLANRRQGTKDCIGPLIDYRDESGQPLSLKSLQIEAHMMLVGGTDTTATTTSYTAWEIARNPQIQENLFQELQSVFSDKNAPIVLKAVDSKLPYLTNCIKEGLRMHTVLPGPTCRVVPDTGAILCGYNVSPGVYTDFHWQSYSQ